MRRFPRRGVARSSRPMSRLPVEMLEPRTLFAAWDLDTTLGGGTGKVTTDFFFGNDTASGVTVLPDGRIMVVGTATGATTQIAVVRYTASGDLDPTFDGDGKAFVDYFGGADAATAVQFQP